MEIDLFDGDLLGRRGFSMWCVMVVVMGEGLLIVGYSMRSPTACSAIGRGEKLNDEDVALID